MPKRDPQQAKDDRRMKMSPVIRKQAKERLKGSRREKKEEGRTTVRSNDREETKFRESESGVQDPFRPRVYNLLVALGMFAAYLRAERRDKEMARKRKKKRNAERRGKRVLKRDPRTPILRHCRRRV